MELLVTLTNANMLAVLKDRGADGVIIGLKNYSDRMNRKFSIFEFDEIYKRCKDIGLKLFVNINNVFSESEMDNIKVLLFSLKEYDLDGIIFNDMAIFYVAKLLKMEKILIYHPDTLMTNHQDAGLIKAIGVKDVILSKDITLDEIKKISGKINKVSMVIHGRLNLSYSKRKFLKNYYEHLDSNYNYKKHKLSLREETRDYKFPIKETARGTSIFTDYTFETFAEFKELKKYLNYGIVDDIFTNEDELLEILTYYSKIDIYSDSFDSVEYFSKKYPDSAFSTGFLYRKTASKKEELENE